MEHGEHGCCSGGCMPVCKGMKLVLVGGLLVLNDLFGWVSWGILIGVLVALKGLFVIAFKGSCPCRKGEEKKHTK